MSLQVRRIVAVALAAATLFFSVPTESQAFFGWFRNWFGRRSCYRQAAYPSVACNTCPQTVTYVPQTDYRVQYCRVPVTRMRPTYTCDTCVGQQVRYRPVVEYAYSAQRTPYTTYRIEYGDTYASTACATCGTVGCTTCNAGYDTAYPSTSMPAASSSNCANCVGSAGTSGNVIYDDAPALGAGEVITEYGSRTEAAPAAGSAGSSNPGSTTPPPDHPVPDANSFAPRRSTVRPVQGIDRGEQGPAIVNPDARSTRWGRRGASYVPVSHESRSSRAAAANTGDQETAEPAEAPAPQKPTRWRASKR